MGFLEREDYCLVAITTINHHLPVLPIMRKYPSRLRLNTTPTCHSHFPTAIKELETPYPLIDADPHFSRVVRNFRQSDYLAMAGATAAFPSAIYLMGELVPCCYCCCCCCCC